MQHARPSLVDFCPRLRHRARRTTAEIRRLVQILVADFPDAALLAQDPRLAECMDSTPYDHVAADIITCARALSRAIAELDSPT
jgi:hypothetical protein